MKRIEVPFTDVNTEAVVLVCWHFAHGELVSRGQLVATVETTKAVVEIESESEGYLLPLSNAGDKVAVGGALGMLFSSIADLEVYREGMKSSLTTSAGGPRERAISAKAEQLAIALGVTDAELSTLKGFITEKMVRALAEGKKPVDWSGMPQPLTTTEPLERRVVLIGGGGGAEQVIEILRASGSSSPVAILDDTREKWGATVEGVPILGATSRLSELYGNKVFGAVIICISTSVDARRKFRLTCEELGIPLANAIDPSVRMASDCVIGAGNVVCAFCHFGTKARIGHNNFISAYNSFDHHNELGNDISSGPGCMTSGNVKVGDAVRLGTGIFVQPKVTLGEKCSIASGAVILTNVPPGASVKLSSSNYTIREN